MIEPNDIGGRTAEIRKLMGPGDAWLKKLMGFVDDFSEEKAHRQEVTVIYANFRNVQHAERRKTLSFQEAQKERNHLYYQALDLLDEVVEALDPEAN